ncbi:MAG: RagB/SusD family nutrient uptake outer membrane protein [Chitinophagaceae bacterium]|nr:RagB/SusD family nutrient uptake outer membrane protein [Chitinophagaceae bacterium]
MKKITYIILPFSLIFLSCSKTFLDKAPESSITSGNFYKTSAQFDQALVGAYASLRGAKGFSDAVYPMAEMRSDNTHFIFNNGNRALAVASREDADEFLDVSTSPIIAANYNNHYSGIARVNTILGNVSKAGLTEQDVNRITGQAKFLRALYYFDLVRYFGGVPLYLSEVTNTTNAYLPRSSVKEVYDAIVDDLKDAVAKLPVPGFPQNGRATQGAARMLLADVYLTQKNYPLAESELKSIIGMGYSLLPDYASVFALSNKNSVESIFEIQYQQGNQGQNSNWYQFLPLSGDLSLITGITSYNGSTSTGGFNIPTGDLIESYEANDTRLDASIAIAEGTGVTEMMVIEAVKSARGYTPPPGKIYVPFIKKFVHPHALLYNTDDNFPVYRYAEALLSLAEVLNEQDKSPEALTYLNQVRSRAGLEPSTETNRDLLRAVIDHERRVEFAFENKRWFDLVRTGKAVEVMNNHGVYIKAVHAGESYLPANSYKVTANHLLYPIPFREVQIGRLDQNPGY